MEIANKRVAVLGKGMLGRDVMDCFTKAGARVCGFDLPEWNITRAADIERAVADAEIVINCAAYTNVDGAEADPETAMAVNGVAVERLAEVCRQRNVYLIHISTDFVYDGKKDGPYTEEDPPAPLNVYGKSKLAGERAVLDSDVEGCVIRVEWTYGVHGRHFISKISELAGSRDQIKVVADQIGSPTPTRGIARALLAVTEKRATGLFNYACRGYTSRFECARLVVETLGLDCEVIPCTSEAFPTPARRPLNSRFDCSRFDRLIGGYREDWEKEMKQFLEENRS